ncbi:MAG: DUF4349 domain-containing protein [Anaerolineales bacterium]|nr:DUF4349 domain-containing protein [Anaerolineales bacterium]MCS7248647.1 DUF4349 domain-containing protein [Anaerolineales bacterium]MDW8162460.1 DUF4349 domain-containing protein [Anaerolineales bacterium]MDW8447895.1 DUF4349 domain-containing protein [Anaerolineales bacterium]
MKSPFDSSFKPFLGVAVLALLLSACASAAPTPMVAPEMGRLGEKSYAPPSEISPLPAQPAYEAGTSPSSSPAAVERMVIKTANLSLIVQDPPSAMDAIAKTAEEMGGYVVSANLYRTTTRSGKEVPQASITVRVPAEKLNLALEEIKALSDELPKSENITSQDITAEYTDLESRLRNLKRAEEQLQEIMDRAYSTEDVLNVYQQLVQVREQIEVIEGQMKYYRESVALSAISVELIAAEAVEPITIAGWRPVGVARNALQALINALQFFVNAAIWIGIFVLPVLLILYGVVFLPLRALWRLVRRRRKPQSNPAAESASPPSAL